MISAVVFIVLVSAVAMASRRYGAAGPIRTCCSAARWPPDDLTDRQRSTPVADPDGPVPPRRAPSHDSERPRASAR